MPYRVFFDTNVLVYAHDTGSRKKKARSQELIFKAIRNRTGVVSPQVLSEFFVTVTQKVARPMDAECARREIILLATMATVDLDATLVVRAIDMKREHQLNYWGALILAAAERAECPVVYSEDLSHDQSYGGVTVQNPYI